MKRLLLFQKYQLPSFFLLKNTGHLSIANLLEISQTLSNSVFCTQSFIISRDYIPGFKLKLFLLKTTIYNKNDDLLLKSFFLSVGYAF